MSRSLSSRLRVVWEHAARAGDPLPSEETLAIALGASRPAVREALVRLEAEGLVRRQVGAGTYPNVMALEMGVRLDVTCEFTDMVRDAGFTPSVELLDHGWTTIGEQDAAALARVAGDRAYRTTKRWSADGTPVMVAIDLVPSSATAAPEDPSQSVLCLTRELSGEDTDWLCAWPSATAMPAEIATLFARPEGEPVLQLDQVGVNRRGTRVFVAHEYHVPGPLKYGLIRTIRH